MPAINLHPRSVHTCALLAYALLAHALPPPAFAAESAASVTQTREELARVTAAIADIERWLEDAAADRDQFETRLRETEQQMSDLSAAVTTSRAAVSAGESELARLSAERGRLDRLQREQLGQVNAALRSAYMSGRDSYLKVLLNQENPELAARMLRYYDYFSQSRLRQLAVYVATLAQIDSVRLELAARTENLEQERQDLESQLQELDLLRDERRRALLALNASISERGGELSSLVAQRQQLDELLDQIQRAIEELPALPKPGAFAESRGQLPWPVDGAVHSRFGDTYGDGSLRRNGLFITAPGGSPIRAVHGGRVVFADWLRGTGLLVVVDHGDGYMSLYGNNESLQVEAGSQVSLGEVIAGAGNSGGVPETGVYFEIRQQGQAINPAGWLQSRN
ncbi:MAG: peptidoglycan DD-metalloendopeptidase family protein [Pseudohongiellaceae bacterium]